MLRYTIRQLEYLVAVAESGSIVEAARRLHVTQPTVSDALAKLEAQFGLDVFVRHHARGVSLTPAGRRLLPAARDLLRHLEEFERDAVAASDEVSGRLDVACYVTLAPRYMPGLLTGFGALHPAAEIHLHEAFQDELIQGIRAGRFDLAFLYDLELPDDLAVEPLVDLQPYVLLPPGHRLAKRRRIQLSSLRDEPFIQFDASPSREYFAGVLREAGVEPKVAFASPSFEMVRGLVGQGRGYSLLVTRPHSEQSYDGKLPIERPIAGRVRPSRICLARRAGVRTTRLQEAFTAFCRAEVAKAARRMRERRSGA